MAETLKEKTARGLMWGGLNSGTTQLFNLVFGICLGRLLSPADYGLVGVLSIFSLIAGNLQSSGFSTAVVNMKRPQHRDYNAVFWFNVLTSAALYILLFLSAPLIADFFHREELTSLSRVVFLSFFISSFGISANAYMTKNMMQREMAIVSAAALTVSGVTSVAMAMAGMTYWSIAAQQVVNSAMLVAGRFCFVRWRPTLSFDFTPIRQTFGFSMKILVTMVVTSVSNNILTVIFGNLLGMRTTGNFFQANKWNTLAHALISTTVMQVAQPVLVEIRSDRVRERRVFRKMMRFTAFLSFPALLGLSLVSREFLLTTIGSKWLDAAPMLQILCIGGAFMPFYTLYQNLVISHGRSDINMWLNIAQIVLQIGVIVIISHMGVTLMVAAYTALNIAWLATWQAAAHRLTGLRLADVARDLLPFLLAAAGVMAVCHFATLWIETAPLLLLARIALAATLYTATLRMAHAQILDECLRFVRDKRRRRA